MEKDEKITLTLKNIGILKEAEVVISGLSIIIGANDSGKSTVSKALMALIKADNMGNNFWQKHHNNTDSSDEKRKSFDRLISLLFDDDISKNGEILLQSKEQEISVSIENDKCIGFTNNAQQNTFLDCTFVQSPLVWDLFEFFSSIGILQTEGSFYRDISFEFKYSYVLWDLYKKLNINREHETPYIKEILKFLKSTMEGQFIKKDNKFYFLRAIDEIQLKNLATGIKSFGIIQMLLENCYVTSQGFFIFDEPENHLHPKWQFAFAKILVKLVEKGIRIMVNTHSSYMLNALRKYAQKDKVEVNLYAAKPYTKNEYKIELLDENDDMIKKEYFKVNDPFIKLDD